jgi:hypothetical protein
MVEPLVAPVSARDQQKWVPVLRPIARQLVKVAHDLIGEPVPTSPDHAHPGTRLPIYAASLPAAHQPVNMFKYLNLPKHPAK